MNRKLTLGVLFILAIFTSATYINFVSAEESSPNISTTIVISQVYGGGGANTGTPTYKYDYVELFNLSSSPQSLNGLSIMYGSATGQFGSSATNIAELPSGVTLQPGQCNHESTLKRSPAASAGVFRSRRSCASAIPGQSPGKPPEQTA